MTPYTQLKIAAEKIKELFRKHDMAATVVLNTPGLCEVAIGFRLNLKLF